MAINGPFGAAGTPISGPRGRVQVAGSNITGKQWQFKDSVDYMETTSFEDVDVPTGETYETGTYGTHHGSGTIVLWIDVNNMPNVAYGLVAGALLLNMYLFIDKRLNARRISMPFARITDVQWGAELKGAQEVTVSFHGHGTFVGPS